MLSLPLLPTPDDVAHAAANTFDMLVRGGVADLRRTPARIIDEQPKGTVFQYLAPEARTRHLPVLLVPPLAAPPICFDLRRGCSMAEHLLGLGHPTYLVEYGSIGYSDRDLGLEHWVEDVLPGAIAHGLRARRRQAGAGRRLVPGRDHVAAGARRRGRTCRSTRSPWSPARSTSPSCGCSRRSAAWPTSPTASWAPRSTARWAARRRRSSSACSSSRRWTSTSPSRSRSRPTSTTATSSPRSRRSTTSSTTCTPTRGGRWASSTTSSSASTTWPTASCALGDHDIDLADVRVPVLAVAGKTDVLAPRAAVHHVGELLTGAPEVQLKTGPGGHLGVLTGRSRGADDVALDRRVLRAQRARCRAEASPRPPPSPPSRRISPCGTADRRRYPRPPCRVPVPSSCCSSLPSRRPSPPLLSPRRRTRPTCPPGSPRAASTSRA